MKCLILFFSIVMASNAFAHGEDKLGPNSGYIKMPGTFHTELVANKDGSFFIYLLDLQNKSPATKDSSVELQFKNLNRIEKFNCMIMGDYFHCQGNAKSFEKGQIILKAKRLGVQAKEAIYDLPLKLKEVSKKEHDMKNM